MQEQKPEVFTPIDRSIVRHFWVENGELYFQMNRNLPDMASEFFHSIREAVREAGSDVTRVPHERERVFSAGRVDEAVIEAMARTALLNPADYLELCWLTGYPSMRHVYVRMDDHFIKSYQRKFSIENGEVRYLLQRAGKKDRLTVRFHDRAQPAAQLKLLEAGVRFTETTEHCSIEAGAFSETPQPHYCLTYRDSGEPLTFAETLKALTEAELISQGDAERAYRVFEMTPKLLDPTELRPGQAGKSGGMKRAG